MIGIKETGELPIEFGVSGTITTSSAADPYVVPLTDVLGLKGIIVRLGTPGGTQATIVDVLKNGSTIFSSGKVSLAATTGTPTYGVFTSAVPTFTKGDVIKITVTQVGSGPAPADLAVSLLLVKPSATKYPAATVTDGF
jgi:hypothetical protein